MLSRTWMLWSVSLVVACGGNVVVDHGASGGNGGRGGGAHGGNGAGAGGSSGSSGSGGRAPSCDAPAVAPSNGACFTNVGSCNPVTASPCNVEQGESCDIGPNGFTCFSINIQGLCHDCDNKGGPFCAATLTCLSDGKCTRYCCDDGDCGSGVCNTHDPALAGTGVGVCNAK